MWENSNPNYDDEDSPKMIVATDVTAGPAVWRGCDLVSHTCQVWDKAELPGTDGD